MQPLSERLFQWGIVLGVKEFFRASQFVWSCKTGSYVMTWPSTQLSMKFQLLIKTKIPTNKEVCCFKSVKMPTIVIKLFSCSTQLSMKFILLINVKMPTIVDILTFISMINTTSERLKARNFFICRYFSFYEQLKFHAQLSWVRKKFYNLRAICLIICY